MSEVDPRRQANGLYCCKNYLRWHASATRLRTESQLLDSAWRSPSDLRFVSVDQLRSACKAKVQLHRLRFSFIGFLAPHVKQPARLLVERNRHADLLCLAREDSLLQRRHRRRMRLLAGGAPGSQCLRRHHVPLNSSVQEGQSGYLRPSRLSGFRQTSPECRNS